MAGRAASSPAPLAAPALDGEAQVEPAAPAPSAAQVPSIIGGATARADAAAPAPKVSAPPARPAAAAAQGPQGVPVGSAPGCYINVGLFAEEANARRAQARLLNEGLPAFRQELHGVQGRRIRVRAGPYASRGEAAEATRAVRALGLEAAAFRQ